MRLHAQSYEFREAPAHKPGPVRRVLGPAATFLMLFYVGLFLQQAGRYLAAHILGAASVRVRIGVGDLISVREFFGQEIGIAGQWWWGPQVTARGSHMVTQTVSLLGPGIGVALVALLLWDARRNHNTLTDLGIIANLAAVCTTVAITYLTT